MFVFLKEPSSDQHQHQNRGVAWCWQVTAILEACVLGEYTPENWRGKYHPTEKEIKSFEPNLHDFGFHVSFPNCNSDVAVDVVDVRSFMWRLLLHSHIIL